MPDLSTNFSFIWILIVCCLYITSVFYGLVILEYVGVALVNLNAISDSFNPTYESKDPCSVCSNNRCKRHKLLPHSTKVKIPKDLDHALEQVINHCNSMLREVSSFFNFPFISATILLSFLSSL